MKNVNAWVATKYQIRGGKLRASAERRFVRPGSRLVVDLVAHQYQMEISLHARGTLVDLGCGNAPLYLAYQSLAKDVICIDWPQSPHLINHIDLSCDLNGPIPLDSESVDTILISDVIEHIAKPWVVWGEMARILKPEGKIIGNVPFMYWIHEAPHDYHRYTDFALRKYASDGGLEVVMVRAFGGLLEILGDILCKVVSRLPIFGGMIAGLFAELLFAWYRTGIGGRLAVKTAQVMPAGYFFVMRKPALQEAL